MNKSALEFYIVLFILTFVVSVEYLYQMLPLDEFHEFLLFGIILVIWSLLLIAIAAAWRANP